MARLSANKFRRGHLWTGFDYDLQVWVVGGIVQKCAHPETLRSGGRPCCNAYRLAGQKILDLSDTPINKNTRNLRLLKK